MASSLTPDLPLCACGSPVLPGYIECADHSGSGLPTLLLISECPPGLPGKYFAVRTPYGYLRLIGVSDTNQQETLQWALDWLEQAKQQIQIKGPYIAKFEHCRVLEAW